LNLVPIRKDLRWFYPIDWVLLSRRIRFERARGRCESCGRPHGRPVRQLPDGRWYDEERGLWRDDRGREAPWPDIVDWCTAREKRIWLGTAHLDHDPGNSRARNLRALCQRCHLCHDRPEHLRRRRITFLLRRALGDLFAGPHRHW
jgi:hypothetical protein